MHRVSSDSQSDQKSGDQLGVLGEDGDVFPLHSGVPDLVGHNSYPLLQIYWPRPISMKAQESKDARSSAPGREDELANIVTRNWDPDIRPGKCMYCLMLNDHYSTKCPYMDTVPKNATVGNGCEVVCKVCGALFRGSCCGRDVGRAISKVCCICGKIGEHWPPMCPRTLREGKNISFDELATPDQSTTEDEAMPLLIDQLKL
ncbi:unnamed protein product [Prunus armeniaca]|uniref:Uncharacterized protein n=1 Tax=Prunus armeniaca TaxID=36596 RepID=A0A6J5X153_PRUAR|nr:unnamed protein product [Prunus armeniaca]CAB4306421.1 unnamed protein product [Prunus armeniaca]